MPSKVKIARSHGYEVWADEILSIAASVEGSQNPAAVNAARLAVDSRKWLLSKLHPEQYGERVELSGAGGRDLFPASPEAQIPRLMSVLSVLLPTTSHGELHALATSMARKLRLDRRVEGRDEGGWRATVDMVGSNGRRSALGARLVGPARGGVGPARCRLDEAASATLPSDRCATGFAAAQAAVSARGVERRIRREAARPTTTRSAGACRNQETLDYYWNRPEEALPVLARHAANSPMRQRWPAKRGHAATSRRLPFSETFGGSDLGSGRLGSGAPPCAWLLRGRRADRAEPLGPESGIGEVREPPRRAAA